MMGFLDSYKRLERLCRDVMDDDRRVSAYIDEMLRLTDGSRRVSGWNSDLRKLKHYRWVRNQIVHEPDCSEENLCSPEDAQWLEDFYERIMTQTDPLALYRKATQRSRADAPTREMGKPHSQPAGCLPILAIAALVFTILIL